MKLKCIIFISANVCVVAYDSIYLAEGRSHVLTVQSIDAVTSQWASGLNACVRTCVMLVTNPNNAHQISNSVGVPSECTNDASCVCVNDVQCEIVTSNCQQTTTERNKTS